VAGILKALILVLVLHLSSFAQAVGPDTTATPIVKVTKEGEVFVNKKRVKVLNLAVAVQKLGSSTVYLSADKETAWDVMIAVLNRLQTANIQMKLLVTWPLVPQDSK
jgi:biopolymer transport protein ExbD